MESSFFEATPELEQHSKTIAGEVEALFGTDPETRIGIRSGFSEFDQITRGYHQGKLYVAGGRPGSGKTSWVTTQIANILAYQRNQPVIMFSTELTEVEIICQIIESYTNATPVFPNGRKSTSHEVEVLKAGLWDIERAMRFGLLKIVHQKRLSTKFINDTVNEYCDKTLGGGFAFVVIDQASRIKRTDKQGHGYALATEQLLNDLERLAGYQECPVLLLTQLGRATEYQQHPTMANFKHSGAFEEFAHAAFLLEKCAANGQEETPGLINNGAAVYVAKNRHGRVGKIEMLFFGEAHTWREYATGLTV